MNYTPAAGYSAEIPDYRGLTHVRVSQDGMIDVGVFRVIFGWRVRVSYVGQEMCMCDLCCGGQWEHVELLYSKIISILETRPDFHTAFAGIPETTKVKPYFNDEEFMDIMFDGADHPTMPSNQLIRLERPIAESSDLTEETITHPSERMQA